MLRRPSLLRAALAALLLLAAAPAARAQTATLGFSTRIVPAAEGDPDPRDVLEVTVLVRSSAVFGLGNTQLIFTFNDAALDFPDAPAAGTDYAFQNYNGFVAPAFYSSTVTHTGAPDEVQVNITLLTVGNGQDVPTSDTEVVRLFMRIDDASATAELAWDAASSQVFQENNVTAVGGSYDSSGGAAQLPVELASFEAVADAGGVLLRWTTTSETNNAGFEVERQRAGCGAQDGAAEAYGEEAGTPGAGCLSAPQPAPGQGPWTALAFVSGHGTTAQPQAYTYRAEGLEVGRHVFRLKQVDYDGTFAYGPEVEVTIEVAGSYRLDPAYPNPFNPQATFTLAVHEAQVVRVEVFDALGRRMALLHDGPLQANHAYRFRLDGASWPSGTYFYAVTGAHFREVRRVLLVK